MNIQKFFFKIFVTLTYLVRVALLVLPIVVVVVISKEGGWKYGFTFIQNTMEVALFVSFAIGFIVSMYHALSYEVVGQGPDENYLKSHQNVRVKSDMSLDEIHKRLESSDLRFKSLELNTKQEAIYGRKRTWFTPPDKIEIRTNGEMIDVHSQPFMSFWFIDFGRNFKNVYSIAKLIKAKK